MPEFWGRWNGNAIEPANDTEAEGLRYRFGDMIWCETKMPRNSEFNAKVRALSRVLFNNQDVIPDYDLFVTVLKMKANFYKTVVDEYGKLYYHPKSLKYSECSEEEAEELFNKWLDIGIKDYCPGSTREEIEENVMRILSFS